MTVYPTTVVQTLRYYITKRTFRRVFSLPIQVQPEMILNFEDESFRIARVSAEVKVRLRHTEGAPIYEPTHLVAEAWDQSFEEEEPFQKACQTLLEIGFTEV